MLTQSCRLDVAHELVAKLNVKLSIKTKALIKLANDILIDSDDKVNGVEHTIRLLKTLDRFLQKKVVTLSKMEKESLVLAIFWHDIWKVTAKKYTVSWLVGLCFEGQRSARIFRKESQKVKLDGKVANKTCRIISQHGWLSFGSRSIESKIFHDLDQLDDNDAQRVQQKKQVAKDHKLIGVMYYLSRLLPQKYFFKEIEGLNKKLPKHIAFILDGNRRWAKLRGLPTFTGHKKGFDTAKKIIKYAYKNGIKVVTLYCFSKENWNRAKEEVNYLMNFFQTMIASLAKELDEMGIKVVHLGDLEGLSKGLSLSLQNAEKKTKNNSKMVIQLALNYTGWDEIKRAVEIIKKNDLQVTIESISKNLDTKDQPDPDIIVRTSGEQRLSGFLLWQAAYAELYFTKVYWPDFTTKEFDKVIEEYQNRERRFGGN